MKRDKKGGIFTNGSVRRTKYGFAKLKYPDSVWNDDKSRWEGLHDHAQALCDFCGTRFCGNPEKLKINIRMKKKTDIKEMCRNYEY